MLSNRQDDITDDECFRIKVLRWMNRVTRVDKIMSIYEEVLDWL